MANTRLSVMALLTALPFSQLSAEITLDGAMGLAGLLAGPDFTIADTLGTTRGANLFHSFSVFNINAAESATFTGPANLDNVISRVTGGTPSSIDGLFRSTVPGADVYFINPFGVIFGQNASLDVQGAFHATTADELRFADGNVFSASNPMATVFTAAAPAAFGFLGANPAGIAVNDSVLAVPTGETLSLVGGDITIAGTDRNRPSPHVEAANGRLNLVSVDASGGVTIAGGVLDAGGFAAHGDITVADSRLQVSGSPGGTVYIEGGNIVLDSSHLWSDSSGPADGGNITFKGSNIFIDHEDVRISGDPSQPRIRTTTSGTGRGGDLRIEADSLTVNKGVRVWAATNGPGRGGDMLVDVDRLEVRNTGVIAALADGTGRSGDVIVNADNTKILHEVASGRDTGIVIWTGTIDADATGDGGNVLFTSRTVDVVGTDARLGPFNDGRGRGGSLVLNAERLTIREGAVVDSDTEGVGDAGNIKIKVGQLEIRSAATIVSSGFVAGGDAGDIAIEADSILLSADGRFDTETNIIAISIFSGDAGNIDISTGILVIRGGNIATRTIDGGQGGDITIAADSILLDGGGAIVPTFPSRPIPEFTAILSNAALGGSGAAGNIDITSGSIDVRGGAVIDASTASSEAGGVVTVQANTILVQTDGRIDTETVGSGPGGNINLRGQNIILTTGGNIIASSTGSGSAGDINISVSDVFQSSGGFVSTEALASDGGNITVNAVRVVDLLDSAITTSVGGGAGAGGNINIDPQFVIVQNSTITANAFGGPGGNINIVAGVFLIDPSSVISASSALGIDGIINVDSPVADVTSGVTALPATVLDASTLVQAPCAARTAGGTSSLTSAGRSGLPAGPDGYLPSLALATRAVSTAEASNVPEPLPGDMQGESALLLAMSGLGCS